MLLEGLNFYDNLRSGAVLLAFGAILVGERCTKRVEWLRAEMALSLVGGLLLGICPDGALIHICRFKLDLMTAWYVQTIGMLLLTNAARIWFTKNPDNNVTTSWLLSKYVGGTGALLTMGSHHIENKEFLPQHVSLVMLMVGSLMFMHFYHLIRSDFGDSRTSQTASRLNQHLLFDILLLTVAVTMIFVTPDNATANTTLKDFKYTPLHRYLELLIGCILLSHLVYQMLALRFADDDHKRAIFQSRMVWLFLALPVGFYYQKNYDMSTQTRFNGDIISSFVQLVNCILAVKYTGRAKRA